jgi:putative transposase
MPIRNVALFVDGVFHIYNKSIADYKIFNDEKEYQTMLDLIYFHSFKELPYSFSTFKKFKSFSRNGENKTTTNDQIRRVDTVAYCIMPTHIHLILKEIQQDGISIYMKQILKGYSQYFNFRHNRKGPLWENRFKNTLVENQEQLRHLSRYVHLNPSTTFLTNNPVEWRYSSYRECIGAAVPDEKICNLSHLIEMDCNSYKKFVEDNLDYQRELHKIKNLCLE